MLNIPKVKLGFITVSNSNNELASSRRQKVLQNLLEEGIDLVDCSTIVENEIDAIKALSDIRGINSLVIFIGNYGSENAVNILCEKFTGPIMIIGAAEESVSDFKYKRGDSLAGILAINSNLKQRGIKTFIPTNPVTTSFEIALDIIEFTKIASICVGIKRLKVFSFGTRPNNLTNLSKDVVGLNLLGVKYEEYSEFDLYLSFKNHLADPRIAEIMEEMKGDLPNWEEYEDILPRMAAYELTLLDWYLEHRGICKFSIFAINCNSIFENEFGFLPCYVHSRLSQKGISVSTDNDIYGVLSQYILHIVAKDSATSLDITCNIPQDLYDTLETDYDISDTFLGFHCGNAPIDKYKDYKLSSLFNNFINYNPNEAIDTPIGVLEGNLKASPVTMFRLVSDGGYLKSYVAEGDIIDADVETFGTSAVIGINNFNRFYRNVLIPQGFTQKSSFTFSKVAFYIIEALKLMNVTSIATNIEKTLYPNENPFKN